MPATPLVRPAEFFAEREEVDLLVPAVVVWLSTVLLIGSVVLANEFNYDLPTAQLAGVVAIAGVLGGFAAWGVDALLVSVASRLLGGSAGGFWRTLGALGWGYLPLVVGGVVDVAAALLFSETTTTVTDPLASPGSVLLVALGFWFVLWQGYVWFVAVQHVRGLTARRSALAVAIPLLLPLMARIGL